MKQDCITYPPDYQFNKTNLTSIKDLTEFDIRAILDRALDIENMSDDAVKSYKPMAGHTQINLFFENSTRTQSSFELAGRKLGADILNMSVSTSSVKKGETLLDTAATLNSMKPDVLVVRHGASGAVDLLSQKVGCSVINAGDGTHEHPTQALLDAYTIRQKLGYISRARVVICGDILHSRVARSNILLLNALGVRVKLVAPPALMPKGIEQMGVEISHNLRESVVGADIIMMLRLQNERMQSHFIPVKEYYLRYGLTLDMMNEYAPNAFVMHPGPVNRGIEIESRLVDNPKYSLIQNQVQNGVTIRTAVLDMLYHARQRQILSGGYHA
jgi:aspartate carbamoyltransferase catalytic subunit